MSVEYKFDASELMKLQTFLKDVPTQIRQKAMGRAMRRMRDMAKTRIIKQSADRVNIQQKYVRDITKARFDPITNTIEIVEKGGWIPVSKMNPQIVVGEKGRSGGVSVRFKDARGSYRSAFLAKMSSGHEGVFKRMDGSKRLPIREMYGPNPAHDVTNNPDEFIEILADLIQHQLAPRVLHEVENLFARKL